MTRLGIAVICVAATTWMCASTAAAGAAIDTFPTLSWTDNDNGTDFFDGELQSAKAKCERDRRVTLFRKAHGGAEKVKRVTSEDGSFVIEIEDPGSGRYYVEVKRKRLASFTCDEAQTGKLTVTDLEGV